MRVRLLQILAMFVAFYALVPDAYAKVLLEHSHLEASGATELYVAPNAPMPLDTIRAEVAVKLMHGKLESIVIRPATIQSTSAMDASSAMD